MNKDSIIDFLGFIILKALSIFFCCTPLPIALWVGRRAGDLVYLVNSKRRSIAYANLKSSFPEKDACEIRRITKAHFQNLGMNVVELLKLPVMGRKYLDSHVDIKDSDRIEDAFQRGKGVIFLAAHFGNWEISSIAMATRGHRVSVFAREQKYTRMNNLLNSYRQMTGCKVVTKGFSVRDIIKALKANEGVGMLADQDAGANGVFIDFLNRPASTAQGPVAFGLKTGATILPSLMHRVGHDRHALEMGEALQLINTGDKEKDIKANLEKVRDILESYIKRFPAEWLWSHKRWKSTPQRTVLVLSDGKTGHLNQAMAVAEMVEEALGSRLKARGINERPAVEIRVVELRFKNRLTRVFLDMASVFAGRRCQGCLRCLRFCLKKESFDEIQGSYADAIISCGASTIGANAFLRYENNAKAIAIMKPGLGRRKKFDLVILPRHDASKSPAPNILITQAAPNKIVSSDERRTTSDGIGLLIGGDAKNFKLEKRAVEKVVDGISKIADEMDRELFVSTSRRTSLEIGAFLRRRLSSNKRCGLLVIANENNKKGVVQEIFDQSEMAVVSPESISMISEAVSSGKYVVVFTTGSHMTKYERAIADLEKQGYIKTAAPDEVYSVVKKLLTEKPAMKKLNDRKKIIDRLKAII